MIAGQEVEQVREFVYLGSTFTKDGKCEGDIKRRLNAKIMANRAQWERVKESASGQAFHRGVLIPALIYGS